MPKKIDYDEEYETSAWAYNNELGNHLNVIRTDRNISAEAAGAVINKSIKYLGRVERGDAKLSVYDFLKLCELYEVDPAMMLNLEGRRPVVASILALVDKISSEDQEKLLRMLQIFTGR